MKNIKILISSLLILLLAQTSKAQNLDVFTVDMKPDAEKYLSLNQNKAYHEAEAQANKSNIHLALIRSTDGGKSKLEWYNLSGKGNKTPKDLNGTTTLINVVNFDRDQFDKCKTQQDLQRMTGYLTSNSLSHYASITNDLLQGIKYACFIVQMGEGQRALLWITQEGDRYKVEVKNAKK